MNLKPYERIHLPRKLNVHGSPKIIY
jgi:hypothetical protein